MLGFVSSAGIRHGSNAWVGGMLALLFAQPFSLELRLSLRLFMLAPTGIMRQGSGAK